VRRAECNNTRDSRGGHVESGRIGSVLAALCSGRDHDECTIAVIQKTRRPHVHSIITRVDHTRRQNIPAGVLQGCGQNERHTHWSDTEVGAQNFDDLTTRRITLVGINARHNGRAICDCNLVAPQPHHSDPHRSRNPRSWWGVAHNQIMITVRDVTHVAAAADSHCHLCVRYAPEVAKVGTVNRDTCSSRRDARRSNVRDTWAAVRERRRGYSNKTSHGDHDVPTAASTWRHGTQRNRSSPIATSVRRLINAPPACPKIAQGHIHDTIYGSPGPAAIGGGPEVRTICNVPLFLKSVPRTSMAPPSVGITAVLPVP
jgi:hypothetical protein